MNNLTFCLKNGIELFLNHRKGQIFITLNGYIKLSGKPKQTISERTTRAALVGKVLASATLKVPGRATKGVKLIPIELACEWLAKDNPELAQAVGDDLFGFLGQSVDLSQYHKLKTTEVETVMGIPTTGHEIVTESEPTPTTNNLERFNRNGIELVIDTQTGEAFATQVAYARMSGLSQQAVNKRCKGYNQSELKMAELITAGGIQAYNLIPAKLVFKWAIKDNPELAEAMGAAGATVYMHQLAGFKITSDAIAKPEPEPTPEPSPQLELPPADIRLDNALKNLDRLGIDLQNPRIKSGLQDWALDLLKLNQTVLPAPDAPNQSAQAIRSR